MRYKIGIPVNFGQGYVGIPSSYFDFFSEFDSEVIPLSPKHSFREDLDLLVLLGGADVNPIRYGGIPTIYTGYPDPVKEYFDTYWLPKYIEAGIPIFGICRGHQTLNVHFGGTIKEVNHPTNPSNNGAELMHKIFGYFPNPIMGFDFSKNFSVNSRHHQGFSPSNMANTGMIPVAQFNNCVEAAAHEHLPIVSVQWHPEDIIDDFSVYAIEYLLTHRRSIINEKILSQIKKQELQLRPIKA